MLLVGPLFAQQKTTRARVGRDGIPVIVHPYVVISERAPTEQERRAYLLKIKRYERLRRNVRRVYPLARECAHILNETDARLKAMGDRADKKKYIRELEKELFRKYEKKLRRLTLSQGRLLIKLIHRETTESAYRLIFEYKSWRSAALWQLVAKFFGANLKEEYDPEAERIIELIIQEIESGSADNYRIIYH